MKLHFVWEVRDDSERDKRQIIRGGKYDGWWPMNRRVSNDRMMQIFVKPSDVKNLDDLVWHIPRAKNKERESSGWFEASWCTVTVTLSCRGTYCGRAKSSRCMGPKLTGRRIRTRYRKQRTSWSNELSKDSLGLLDKQVDEVNHTVQGTRNMFGFPWIQLDVAETDGRARRKESATEWNEAAKREKGKWPNAKMRWQVARWKRAPAASVFSKQEHVGRRWTRSIGRQRWERSRHERVQVTSDIVVGSPTPSSSSPPPRPSWSEKKHSPRSSRNGQESVKEEQHEQEQLKRHVEHRSSNVERQASQQVREEKQRRDENGERREEAHRRGTPKQRNWATRKNSTVQHQRSARWRRSQRQRGCQQSGSSKRSNRNTRTTAINGISHKVTGHPPLPRALGVHRGRDCPSGTLGRRDQQGEVGALWGTEDSPGWCQSGSSWGSQSENWWSFTINILYLQKRCASSRSWWILPVSVGHLHET